MNVRARHDAIGVSYLDPRHSIATRHGVRRMNRTAKLNPRRRIDVIVANFTRVDRMLPKYNVIGYAKRNRLANIIPSRETSE